MLNTNGYPDDDEDLLPQGEYQATVADAYYAKSKAGKQKVVVELDVWVGDKRTEMKAHIPLEGFKERINNYIECLRREGDPAEVSPGHYAGRQCRVVIKHSKGDRKTFANVDGFLPVSSRDKADTRRTLRVDAGERNPF